MQKPLLEEKEYLTEYEAAEFYNLSRRRLRRLLQKKGLNFLARYVGRPLIINNILELVFSILPDGLTPAQYSVLFISS